MKKQLQQCGLVGGLLLGFLWGFVAQAAPLKNGFDLADSLIPVEQVLSGGPPRDGIPAIDHPRFVTAEQADFLTADDRVIGVVIKGKARAYPIKILNWHEIVNDELAGEPIAVTFCPLCGSGMVYQREFLGRAHRFGVSGLLFNSDVLLYDRETKTLWSQILSKAVSGKLRGQDLVVVASSHTSWKSWRQQQPMTQVLSTDTGVGRDYQRSPYGDYISNSRTYFPVAFRSKKYHPKERVLGISIQGKHKVYPFSELAKLTGKTLKDHFMGETLLLSFDVENRDGVIKNSAGKVLPSVNSFWFAWYGFHPKAEIFKGAKN